MLRSFINLLYPKLCASCNKALLKNEQTVCAICLSEMPRTNYYNNPENPVAKLFWGKVQLEAALSAFTFVKKGKIQRLMHELKYRDNTSVGEILGIELGKQFHKMENFTPIDYVIPIPLHPKKLKIRGYNQAESIAIGTAKVLNCEVDTTSLIRTHHSDSQTKKSKFERWENVGSIFKISDIEKLKNKHVLLVDDVITTGSTIEGCCVALQEIEGIKISVGTLAEA